MYDWVKSNSSVGLAKENHYLRYFLIAKETISSSKLHRSFSSFFILYFFWSRNLRFCGFHYKFNALWLHFNLLEERTLALKFMVTKWYIIPWSKNKNLHFSVIYEEHHRHLCNCWESDIKKFACHEKCMLVEVLMTHRSFWQFIILTEDQTAGILIYFSPVKEHVMREVD